MMRWVGHNMSCHNDRWSKATTRWWQKSGYRTLRRPLMASSKSRGQAQARFISRNLCSRDMNDDDVLVPTSIQYSAN